MNTIMKLAIDYASNYANGGGDKSALQAEVTRMERELADYKQRYLDCTAQTAQAEDRAEAAEAKLAAIEAQEIADAAYAAGAKGKVTDGWKLVPIEPTEKMIKEGQSQYGEEVFVPHQVASIWRDMLAASPEPKP